MFRKIHSNRLPGTTLAGSLKKEFSRYFIGAAVVFGRLLRRYPFTAFSLMVASILVSAILAFTVMRQQKPVPLPRMLSQKQAPATVLPGTLDAYEAFKEAGMLQARIEANGRKDSLTSRDSIEVVRALQRIDEIRKQFNPQH
ncbi:hypothetical protein SAMN05216464_1139 [Mucilaginibacter pineti]|uniref:Uncharacterized protein n=1 Tax=Mucilaginibacter pineti TaxID=1391627 RepID=A0A1G7IFL0_9SPHI|nr:hypothetical protein [Mucilaginibacter pineti]SDF11405.1 hypothetical protein SAMN05216464_1139 [Mucilaginibacter pineti]